MRFSYLIIGKQLGKTYLDIFNKNLIEDPTKQVPGNHQENLVQIKSL
jgi:hypothetical protein